jgi:hypothetical protein
MTVGRPLTLVPARPESRSNELHLAADEVMSFRSETHRLILGSVKPMASPTLGTGVVRAR